jgi:MFS family permease
VIIATFPEQERGPAIGTWTASGTIAGALGPLIAGAILNVASWPWIFVINLPLVVVCLWLIVVASSQDSSSRAHIESKVSKDLHRTRLPALEIAGRQTPARGELIGCAEDRLRWILALLPYEVVGRGGREPVLIEESLRP